MNKRFMFIITLLILVIFHFITNFVYVDESGINKYFQRDRARARRGVKIHDVKPGRKFARTNVIAGLVNGKHVAVSCYAHSTTAAFFEEWFEWELLSVIPAGSLIIMDNASFHRKAVLYKIAARHDFVILFLPPYSPDYNMIEKSWANLKRWLKDNLNRFFSVDLAIEYYLTA